MEVLEQTKTKFFKKAIAKMTKISLQWAVTHFTGWRISALKAPLVVHREGEVVINSGRGDLKLTWKMAILASF